jgi:hypothetical protein
MPLLQRCGLLRWALVLLPAGVLFACLSYTHPAQAQDAAALIARHTALRDALASNQFQRPLYLESTQNAGDVKGEIFSLIEQPHSVVIPALQSAAAWCDVLILHINVKRCRAVSGPAGERLNLDVGSKHDQPLEQAHHFEFALDRAVLRPDYLQMILAADQGPLGTSRYRVVLEVAPLDARRSFLHLSYSYAYGLAARVALQAYLATAGRDKVGFSIVGRQPDGRPEHIGGMRGVIERNTMRYYLAIESFLAALSAPAATRLEQRLNNWHTGVERYPLQLHELERQQYLDMKHKEVLRQHEPSG